jgi:hypothetical protein
MADYYFFFPNLSIQVGQSPGDIVQSLQTVLAFDPPGPAWRLRTNPCPHAVVLHPSTRCFRLLSIYPNAHSLGRYCSTWNQLLPLSVCTASFSLMSSSSVHVPLSPIAQSSSSAHVTVRPSVRSMLCFKRSCHFCRH